MAFHYFFNRRVGDYDDNTIEGEEGGGVVVRDGNRLPLSNIAEAFEGVSKLVDCGGSNLGLKAFCDACSVVSVLFGCLGTAFKFAEYEYCSKVHDLVEASSRCGTLSDILDIDVKNGSVRTQGSLTRNLRRVRQGIELVRAIFENFLSSEYDSLKDAASTAYAKVCAPHHSWPIRMAVSAGMCTLPRREQLLQKLNETEKSAEKKMRRYIEASLPVIEYIDKLFISRDISLDW